MPWGWMQVAGIPSLPTHLLGSPLQHREVKALAQGHTAGQGDRDRFYFQNPKWS